MSPLYSMPRSLSDPLLERLLRSFPPDRAYTRADWTGDTMPDPVAHFLDQLLTHHSRREARRLRRARTEWVDYDHPEVERAVRTFFDAVESHTQVPSEEWEATLSQATRHTTAHLVRPVHVLGNFVFGEQQKKLRLREVLWRMDFFGPYSYLRKAVRAFAQQKNLEALGPDRFERFLHRVDEQITADFDADRWLRLLDPLFATARYATNRERLPLTLLRTFFADKQATAIEQRLMRYEADGHEEVGPKALYRLIDEASTRSSPPDRSASAPQTERSSPSPHRSSAEPAPPEPNPAPDPEAPSEEDLWGVAGTARPEGSTDPQPAQDDEDGTPLWKRFQGGGPTPSRDTSGNGTGASQQPLWAQFRGGQNEPLSEAMSRDATSPSNASPTSPTHETSNASPAGPSPSASPTELEALEQEILGTSNPPHRAVYVRQLFNGDQTAYRQVLQHLRTADSWGEASQIIASDIFRTYKVNIYSDAAVHFTNAVESRFREG